MTAQPVTPLLQLRIVWISFLLSDLVYAVVVTALLLQREGGLAEQDDPTLVTVRWAMVLVSLNVLPVLIKLKGSLLDPTRLRAKAEAMPAAASDQEGSRNSRPESRVVGAYLQASLILWAIAGTPGILGLVLAILGLMVFPSSSVNLYFAGALLALSSTFKVFTRPDAAAFQRAGVGVVADEEAVAEEEVELNGAKPSRRMPVGSSGSRVSSRARTS